MSLHSLKKYTYYKAVLILGLILAVLWVTFVNTKPFSDFLYYYNVALNVYNGLTWGNTYTAVGYSIVLGFLFKIFGTNFLVAKIFNIVLYVISNVLFLELLDKTKFKNTDKKIMFTLFVFFPNNICYTSIVGTELLFTTITLLVTVIYFSRLKYKYAVLGILVGLNTMIKPFFIIFFLLIFIVELLSIKKLLVPLRNSIIVLIFCCIAIAPWVYRNTKMMGQFTFVSNNGGIVLYINNNSQNNLGRWMAASDVENSIVKTDEYKNANMTEQNKMLSNAAKKWIVSHPKEFISLGITRLENTYFKGDDISYTYNEAGLSESFKTLLYNLTDKVRKIIFKPAILCLAVYSVIILKSIFNMKTNELNVFNLYTTILFYMFTSVYFITEGQGRYAFPLIFIFVYYFYCLIYYLLNKVKDLYKLRMEDNK
ncbi:MAG: hypothetical protein ACM3X7_15175 [Solirubrobacterales bacterium]